MKKYSLKLKFLTCLFITSFANYSWGQILTDTVPPANTTNNQAPVNINVYGGAVPQNNNLNNQQIRGVVGIQNFNAANNQEQIINANGISKLPALNEVDIPASAFKNAKEQAIPVTVEEIQNFKKETDKLQRELSLPSSKKRPVTRDVVMNLSPGASPPIIRPGKNYGTTITFIDETGAPWHITGADGMSDDFTIRWASGTKENRRTAIQIIPNSGYGTGNISVMLAGLEVPIILSVEIGYSKNIDYRVDFRIPLKSPNARPEPVPSPMPSSLPSYVGDILQGVPPSFAKRLKVSNEDGEAYLVENKLVWRTNLMLLSPIPIGYLPSINGTRAYLMEYTPVLFASDLNGQRKQITISEGE